MYTIRKIETEADFEATRQLWAVHSRLMRTPVSTRQDLNIGTIVGAFKGEVLAATMRHHAWRDKPWYSMDSIYVRAGEMAMYASRNGVDNPIVPLIDHVIAEYEAKQYFTWFYVRALTPGYSRIHKKGHSFLASSKLGSRYQKFLMEIVKAGERSPFTVHDNLLGNRVWARDCIVVMQCLKNEYRTTVDALGPEAEYF